MANSPGPSVSQQKPTSSTSAPVRTLYSSARIAGIYFLAGMLWVGISDAILAEYGGLTYGGMLIAVGKGVLFVLLSTGLIYWLCHREIREIRRTTELLQAVIEGTTDAVFVKNENGRYLLVNSAAARFSGRTIDQVVGKVDQDLFDAHEVECLIKSDRAIMAGRRVVTVEETLTSDGVTRTFQATKAPFFNAKGDVQGLVGISRDITDHSRVELVLRETEARLREAQRIARLGSWSWEPTTNRVWWSDALFELYGLSPQDVSPSFESFLGLLHPDDRPVAIARVQAMLAGANELADDLRIVRADGSIMWIHSQARATRNASGEILRVEGTDQDITAQRLARQIVLESELRLKTAVEVAELGVTAIDYESGTAELSSRAAEQFDFPAGRVVTRDELHSRFHPADLPMLEECIAAALQPDGSGCLALEHRVVHNNGAVRWMNVRKQISFVDGRPHRAVLVSADITDRKRAETVLRESEARYRLLFESNPHPMWVYDVSTLRFLAVNDSAIMAYGYSREEFLSMTLRDIRPAEDVPRLESSISNAAPGLSLSQEWRHRRKDGTVFDVEISSHELPQNEQELTEYRHGLVKNRGRTRLVLALDITDRRRAEAELKASEQRLRLALEAAGAIAFVWHIPTDSVTRYYSIEPSLPVNTSGTATLNTVRERIHPEDLAAFDAQLAKCLEHGSAYRNEFRVIRDDGSIGYLDEYGFLNRAADGSPLSLTGLSLDVSERIAATDALRTSEARYRQLVDMLPTAIFVHADHKILFGNAAFTRLMGATNEQELLGRSVFDIGHPSSHPLLREIQDEMSRTRSAVTGYDMLSVRCDGRIIPTHIVAAPVEGYGNAATLVALSDLTERERSTALLRSVLNSVGDAILTIDVRGSITSANRATEQLFGYAITDLLAGNVSLLMPEPASHAHDTFIADYLQNQVQRAIGVGREVEGRRKDGSLFPAELTITEFMRDGEREFTCVLRDITARRQLEEQFRQAQKMEAVGRLAGGVAHDFNNLLTVINGYAELVLADLTADDPARTALTAIHDAGDRAARLTEQLLAFSRKSIVAPRLLDMNELVLESAKLLRRLIGEDIALSVDTEPMPVLIMMDPGQLEQVLMNLAVNARDAMPMGGRLTIATRQIELTDAADLAHANLPAGRYASLTVTDTGDGMSAEIREKIFEPFFTTKGIGKGTGLGLAVVHGIIQQSGGSISVASTVGNGSSFHILLPSVTASSADAALHESPVAPRGTETVLVVEDEDAVRKLVRLTLEGQGYTVLTASDGNQAHALLAAHRGSVDLLVSDVIMPEISGNELAVSLRAARPGLRVLFMSGYTDDALDRHGLQDNPDQFIQKPFTPLGLARRVREILDQPSIV